MDLKKFAKNMKKLRSIEIDLITYGIIKNFKKFKPLDIKDSWKKAHIRHINNDSSQPYLNEIKLLKYDDCTIV